MVPATRTYLAFQYNAKLYTLQTTVIAIHRFTALGEANRQLFKQGGEEDHIVITKDTIFHPQGGGQPSDVGAMKGDFSQLFEVASVRMDAVNEGQVLHLGRFNSTTASSVIFREGDTIEQSIDIGKRLFYSRLHTAGHVLGAAVRHLLEKEIEGFDELKASHFPDSAACEFKGLIEAKWKDSIQKKLEEYVEAKMPVEVEWWDEDDFRKRGLERLIPDTSLAPPGEKFRVVNIQGAEVYPCGGTHVETTDLCGETKVKKISRSKGNSRVSYTVS